MQQYLCCRVYRAGHELLETRMFILVYILSVVVVLFNAVQSFQVGRKTTKDKVFFPVPLNGLIPFEEHLNV